MVIKDPEKEDLDLLLNEDEDKSGIDEYICKKNSLLNIINYKKFQYDPEFHGVLFDAVERVNKIVFHVGMFMKMYFLHLLDGDEEFPDKNGCYPAINVQLIGDIINVITYKKGTRGRSPVITDSVKSIQKFYDKHYKPLLKKEDIICRDNLKQLLAYEGREIIKNIKTNIATHFMSHLRFFVEIAYGFDKELEKINGEKILLNKKNALKKKIYEEMKLVVDDIINLEGVYVSEKAYTGKEEHHHEDIFKHHGLFIPNKASFRKNYVPYDVKANPLDYFIQMIYINREIDEINKKIIVDNQNKTKKRPLYKLFNALPLRTEIVPKYITLDTIALIDLFITTNSKQYRDKPTDYGDLVWKRFFKINSKSFRQNGYKFNHMIKTDGVACSILFIKQDDTPIRDTNVPYLNNMPNDIVELAFKLQDLVYLDPGKNDLFNAMKVVNGKIVFFRYTNAQRKHYTKKIKYQKIRNDEAENTIIKGRSVKEIQESLMEFNSKSCDFEKFKDYVAKKIEVNRLLFNYYSQVLFRKLNWNTYINTQRNEDLVINDFIKKMGSPDKTIIILGDWSTQGIKGKESTILQRLRKIFTRRGFKVYLVDEYNTSKLCSCCHEPTENLKVHENSKSIWKLLRCNSCGAIHNRDHNACKNIKFVTEKIISSLTTTREACLGCFLHRPEKNNPFQRPTKVAPRTSFGAYNGVLVKSKDKK